ncbi:branched-chain amino acid ABC transporter permease [Aquamicrobium sp. LC103]|uniref:branched-chain amino acid ABC transporter permease n=1 Tax=Aquamicrobium sp. LC103 TaxID=1120658 RepID=UPI00063EB980|nr:branched-chain amino acid ABC transporter permease [Aquamicrobium sp. LC103]TKT78386.1 branched-chain amino acid ABC transporter permease [Aquamicrobium sp. LC103]
MTTLYLYAIFNGLVLGAAIFLVAAGLTLAFGIMKIFNFAHGAFFMIGAYVAYAVAGQEASSLPLFLAAAFIAALVVGAIGVVTDLAIFRRLGNVPHEYTLMAAFGIMLFCTGAARIAFGQSVHAIYPPQAIGGFSEIGLPVSHYGLFIIAAGIVTFLALEIGLNRIWFGKLIFAVARDPWMADVVGLRVQRLKLASVAISFALAGLAGGILVANQSLSLDLGHSYLLLAFCAVIVGGLGSIRGAFIASVIFGLAESLNSVMLPTMPGIGSYALLIILVLIRPQGIYPELSQ